MQKHKFLTIYGIIQGNCIHPFTGGIYKLKSINFEKFRGYFLIYRENIYSDWQLLYYVKNQIKILVLR